MDNNKSILVTGSTGSVGRNIHFGRGFSSKEYDLRCPTQTSKMFDNFSRIDAVLGMAARVGGLGFHLNHKYDLFYDNVMINTNVINECRKRQIPRVLSFLSSCIFSDDKKSTPYSENDILEFPPAKVHFGYGYAKRMLAVQSQICYEESGGNLVYNCVIPVNMFGENDDFNPESSHVIASLIYKAYLSYKNNTEFSIWGDGSQKRNFLYFQDVAKLTEWVLYNYLEKEPLIFSDNKPIEIGYVAELIADCFGIKKRMKFDTSKPEGQKIRELDGTKLYELTKFQFTPIEISIKNSVQWFLDNYPNVRL